MRHKRALSHPPDLPFGLSKPTSGPTGASVVGTAADSWDELGDVTLSLLRKVIARVPRGKVITYGQVAAAAGSRAVHDLPCAPSNANRECRGTAWSVPAVGSPSPGEEGREQRFRLEVEGVTFRGGRVRMEVHNWTPRARRAAPRSRAEKVRPETPDPHGLAIPFEQRDSFVGTGRPRRLRDRGTD